MTMTSEIKQELGDLAIDIDSSAKTMVRIPPPTKTEVDAATKPLPDVLEILPVKYDDFFNNIPPLNADITSVFQWIVTWLGRFEKWHDAYCELDSMGLRRHWDRMEIRQLTQNAIESQLIIWGFNEKVAGNLAADMERAKKLDIDKSKKIAAEKVRKIEEARETERAKELEVESVKKTDTKKVEAKVCCHSFLPGFKLTACLPQESRLTNCVFCDLKLLDPPPGARLL
jgi:hypothetical protein